MTTYYAQLDGVFINYLFRKDLSYTRMKDTDKLTDTIIYTKRQLEVLFKLHPDIVPLIYKRATIHDKHLHRTKIDKIPESHINKILKNLNK